MSNSLAVAVVTSTLRHVLDRGLRAQGPGSVGGAKVTTLRPDRLADADVIGVGDAGVNVFCYQVTPNHAWNLTDLPTRRPGGSLAHRPIAAVDLHFLLTFYGDDESLDAQRILGRSVLALAVTPVLTRDVVQTAIDDYHDDPGLGFLSDSDLADQPELVKLSPTPLSLEELSKLWGVFGTPYLLSLTYSATVVLLEADVMPRTGLPVQQRVIAVRAGGPPRIATVAADPATDPFVVGSPLVIEGSSLLGETTLVMVGGDEFPPDAGATRERLVITLTEDVAAGVRAAQVVHYTRPGGSGVPARLAAASNSVPVLVRPSVTSTGVTTEEVLVEVTPPVRAGQRATVSLDRLAGGGPGDPTSLSFVVPLIPPGSPPITTINLERELVAPGDWLVRVEVDGAASLPELVGDTYGAPSVSVP